MNCGDWEERIALYAGGDLGAAEAREVERHLGDCAGCQVFASGLRQALETMRAEHDEAIAPAHYAAVRARVMGELERPRRRWAWVWAAVAVAAMVVMAVGLRRQMRVAELPVVALTAPSAPAMAWARSVPPAAARQATKTDRLPYVAAARKHAAPPEQVLVKVQTDDPDIVIFWIAETKGEN